MISMPCTADATVARVRGTIEPLAEYQRWADRAADRLLKWSPPPPDTDRLVSVCLPVRNSVATVDRMLASLAAQTYRHIELIVVDGASTDGTTETLQRASRVDVLCSEPDTGAEEGINRAIALARGQYVSVIGADDWLAPDHIERCVAPLIDGRADLVISGVAGVIGTRVRYFDIRPLDVVVRSEPPQIAGLGWVVRRSVLEASGLFDRSVRVASDLEFLLRVARQGARVSYAPDVHYFAVDGGHSSRHRIRGSLEVRRIIIAHGGDRTLATVRCAWHVTRESLRQGIKTVLPAGLFGRLRAWYQP